MDIQHVESVIETAWKDTGQEFISGPHPKCVFWSEAAALKYPFYSNLTGRLSKISKKLAVVCEYSPVAPIRDRCGDKRCSCNVRVKKAGVHADFCLVNFRKRIHDFRDRDMWCFKPKPEVAMEFKYPNTIDKEKFSKDIRNLLTMGRVFDAQLLYLCFATYDEAEVGKAVEYISQEVGRKCSVRGRFRVASGSLDIHTWKVEKL